MANLSKANLKALLHFLCVRDCFRFVLIMSHNGDDDMDQVDRDSQPPSTPTHVADHPDVC